jgi:hypothetical protein
MRRMLAGVTRSTAYLALASFFADISSELLYPVLPVFLTQTLNASGSIVGLVEGLPTPPRTSCKNSPAGRRTHGADRSRWPWSAT